MSMKGVKIACFVALPHHTRFLSPITEAARDNGADIVYFTTMSDFPYERDLIKKGKDCKLLQSYSTGSTREQVSEARRAFYAEWTQKCFSWKGYEHWPFVLQSNLLEHGFEEYFCVERFMEVERPDIVMALHERNRWGKLLGHHARKRGIPYVTLQEGDYYEDRLSFTGHTEFTTALMLWGQDTRDQLVRLKAAGEKMVLIGNTHLQGVKKAHLKQSDIASTRAELGIPAEKKMVLVMVGLQWGVIKDTWVWDELLNNADKHPDIAWVFKWHPKVTYNAYKKNAEEMFAQRFPTVKVIQNYDAYKLLAATDYCVTLGKTTLGVEALSFGKPLFSLPGRDGKSDHYAKAGIAQALWPVGNWEPLFETIRNGVPEEVQNGVDEFMTRYFFRNNAVAVERALEVLEHIMSARTQRVARKVPSQSKAGRLSVVLPSGNDPEVLIGTMQALAENIEHPDWELVVIATDSAIFPVLEGISGDVQWETASGSNLAEHYNQGAALASGDVLLFIKPGVVYSSAPALYETARSSVVGVAIDHPDGRPYSRGWHFNFNSVPQLAAGGERIDAVGGGLIALSKKNHCELGGFDPLMHDAVVDLDLCLRANVMGVSMVSLERGLAFLGCESFQGREDDWRGWVAFFAKWAGRLPKDEDFIAYAGDLMK